MMLFHPPSAMWLGAVVGALRVVLGGDGQPIQGLYAGGADMASIMRGRYPGPGVTLGPALVFAWRAVMHALGQR